MVVLDHILGIVLKVYQMLLGLASMFSVKAAQLFKGQLQSIALMKEWRMQNPDAKVFWIHAASLGEFEQGRPVIEEFKERYPTAKVVLTFYSPSGYEVRKNYSGADLILYLPVDTTKAMYRFIKAMRPSIVAIVKYEVWPNMLRILQESGIPVILFSAIFRPQHRFFSGLLKGYWKGVLQRIEFIHVQDEASGLLLSGIGIDQWTVSGDTRYDRVWKVAQEAVLKIEFANWKGKSRVVVLGSSYEEEETMIEFLVLKYNDVKWVIAPHHIDEHRIASIEQRFLGETVRATEMLQTGVGLDKRVLILNTMGDLGGLYRLGEMAVVGGGWGKGIHNILEPAAHGCAVLWGPNDGRFMEAKLMAEHGGGSRVEDMGKAKQQLEDWIGQAMQVEELGRNARDLVKAGTGATDKVLKTIEEKWEGKKR
jgi:3-deoxy-D-manno-octulosonic-acid transferase